MLCLLPWMLCISIHAPRVGSDACSRVTGRRRGFQSTLPAWGATGLEEHVAFRIAISIHAPRVGSDESSNKKLERLAISIHAPRVGSDFGLSVKRSCVSNFNPRSPRGERHVMRYIKEGLLVFQSTLPAWGATA